MHFTNSCSFCNVFSCLLLERFAKKMLILEYIRASGAISVGRGWDVGPKPCPRGMLACGLWLGGAVLFEPLVRGTPA